MGCGNNTETQNLYYIELVNINDSLRNSFTTGIKGKDYADQITKILVTYTYE